MYSKNTLAALELSRTLAAAPQLLPAFVSLQMLFSQISFQLKVFYVAAQLQWNIS